VDIAGEKKEPCAKATSSVAFWVWLTLLALCVVCFCFLFCTRIHGLLSLVCCACGSVACQRLSGVVRVPCRTVSLLCVMVTSLLVNVAVHCASQSCPMESSEVLPSSGKMCAVQASKGKFGKSNSAVCVAIIVSLFGKSTLILLFVFCLFLYGAVTARKCPVHPVSTMIWCVGVVEGPSGVVAVRFSLTLFFMLLAASCSLLGSPRLHTSTFLGVVSLSSWVVLRFFRGTYS